VAQPSSPDPELDLHFVNVEFDDGDSGRINLDDIRLLPADYPIVGRFSNYELSFAALHWCIVVVCGKPLSVNLTLKVRMGNPLKM
jgi:hypothetical protein